MNIYVGNLAYKTREQDLRQAFEAYGEVTSIKLITDKFTGKSKGFGFVEMPNDSQANEAIEKLNDSELLGRKLKIAEAKAREEGERRPGRPAH